MRTSYPDTTIKDDWNDRTPESVTSLYDDLAKSGNKPDPAAYYALDPKNTVETSLGAVPADSDTAKAALDVAMKDTDGDGIPDSEDADDDGDGVDDEDEPTDGTAPFGTSSDPANYTVAEVNAYLAGEISAEERERVVAAEKAGKNRTSVTGV